MMGKTVSVLAILFCMGSASLMAQSIRVGGSSLRANGELAKGFQYTGSCPVDLQFGWGLISTGPTTASYHFARNDGGHSSSAQTVNLPQANRSVPVYDQWRLGANTAQFANHSGWVNLIIDYPSPIQQKISFTIHCR
jgi:hypothetical protein